MTPLRTLYNLLFVVCTLIPLSLLGQPTSPTSPYIRVDQFGYQPWAQKIAVLANPQIGYDAANSYSPAQTYETVSYTHLTLPTTPYV